MSPAFFAALSALFFGLTSVATRRAVLKVLDAGVGVLISVPLALVFFLLILMVMGQVGSIARFSWQSYGWLAAAGVIHFIVGRSLNLYLVQLVGANIASVVRRINPIVSVILGISLLGEPFSWPLAVGVLLIILGLTVSGMNPKSFRNGERLFSGIPAKAYLLGLGVGLSWGTSPILVKLGLNGSGSPVAGAFISYAAATIIASTFLINRSKRMSLANIEKGALGFFCLNALFGTVSQLMRYIALSLGPASVVSPIVSTSPIFLLAFSFIFNRKLEVFSPNVIVGIIVVVLGGILLTGHLLG
jgi:drug/metabolite transporter (DMT)-like permease